MVNVKVDVAALRAKLAEDEKKKEERQKLDVKKNLIVKIDEETFEANNGKLIFRALPYIHNADPSAEPFAERMFQYNIPSAPTTVRSPENDGEENAVSEFIWEQMKKYKGNKEKVKEWAQFLPKPYVFVAGVVSGWEEYGVKFLRLGTQRNKKSPLHKKLYDWFFDENTFNWMSPEKSDEGGFDVELTFKEMSPSQQKMFKTKFQLESIDLSRKSTEFGTRGGKTYEEWLQEIPDLDDPEVYVGKTSSKEMKGYLRGWAEQLEEQVETKEEGTVIDTSSKKPSLSVSSEDELLKKLEEMNT